MKTYSGIDENMVTAFVGVLPKRCLYCAGKCWQVDEYPYACRCSQCSAYFHCEFKMCDDLKDIGYDTYYCTECHDISALRLFELVDGTLVEVCQGCAEWLCEESYK